MKFGISDPKGMFWVSLFKIKIHRINGQSLKAPVKCKKVNSDFTPFLRYVLFRGEYEKERNFQTPKRRECVDVKNSTN